MPGRGLEPPCPCDGYVCNADLHDLVALLVWSYQQLLPGYTMQEARLNAACSAYVRPIFATERIGLLKTAEEIREPENSSR